MCIRPLRMWNGASVPCRRCKQCLDDQVNDWIGRCKAEMLTSQVNLFVTLTYGGDDVYGGAENNLRAKMLHFKDVQDWLKLMRKWTKGSFRYLVVGEYGSEKGRAHWHVLTFSQNMPPNVQLSPPKGQGSAIRYMHKHEKGGFLWPHGWSEWRAADEGGARYVLNYLRKGPVDRTVKSTSMSMKPPLGDAWFKLEAERYVEQGVSPKDHFYRFPNDYYPKPARDGTFKVRQYYLGGAMFYYFMKYFAEAWVRRYGKENWPENEITDWYVEERYVRSQIGMFDWRDEPEWRQLIRQEGLQKWRLGKRAREDVSETKSNKDNGPPLVPLEVYEQS